MFKELRKPHLNREWQESDRNKNELNRNSGGEKYNSSENFTRGTQQADLSVQKKKLENLTSTN